MEPNKTHIILNKKTNQAVSDISYHIAFVTSRNTVKTFSSFEKARARLRTCFTKKLGYHFNQAENPFKELEDFVIVEVELKPRISITRTRSRSRRISRSTSKSKRGKYQWK
jgi:hypothetical protein